MAIITWKDFYNTGIEVIDQQHQKLVAILNEIDDLLAVGQKDKEKKDKEKIEKIIQELIDYTKYHFGDEERLMQENKYPDLDKHKKEHEYFIDKTKEFQSKYKVEEDFSILVELLKFLGDWLIKHILNTDRKYIPYLKG